DSSWIFPSVLQAATEPAGVAKGCGLGRVKKAVRERFRLGGGWGSAPLLVASTTGDLAGGMGKGLVEPRLPPPRRPVILFPDLMPPETPGLLGPQLPGSGDGGRASSDIRDRSRLGGGVAMGIGR
ncbi:unnamed protein product, partial [Discosporangium mesarthrocarpum]